MLLYTNTDNTRNDYIYENVYYIRIIETNVRGICLKTRVNYFIPVKECQINIINIIMYIGID